jgi:erythromycin esterase
MSTNEADDAFSLWARNAAFSVRTDPALQDYEDLRPLAKLIGSARIVGIGESQHFVGVFNRFRARVVRFLVEEMAFTTFAFECDSVTGRAAHDYVAGRSDAQAKAFLGFQNAFGLWEGTQQTLTWMRSWNLKHRGRRQLSFYGIDGSEFWGCAGGALASACDYIDRADPDLAVTIRDSLLPLAATIRISTLAMTDEALLERLILSIDSLLNRFTVHQIEWVKRTDFESFDWARRATTTAAQIATIFREAKRDPDNASQIWWNTRDAGMASLLRWILDREGNEARIVVGAHNIHLQKDFARESNYDQATVAQYLASELDSPRIVMIGGTNNGSLRPGDVAIPNSFQAGLARVGLPEFVLDLRRATDSPGAANWLRQTMQDRTNTGYQPLCPAVAWDAVFFSDQISLDRMMLPAGCQRDFIPMEEGHIRDLVGRYALSGIAGQKVYLRISRELDGLFSHGEDSDGELFPMHRSQLHAVSLDSFVWSDWPLNLDFIRDRDGVAQEIRIRYPDCNQEYRGWRHLG